MAPRQFVGPRIIDFDHDFAGEITQVDRRLRIVAARTVAAATLAGTTGSAVVDHDGLVVALAVDGAFDVVAARIPVVGITLIRKPGLEQPEPRRSVGADHPGAGP